MSHRLHDTAAGRRAALAALLLVAAPNSPALSQEISPGALETPPVRNAADFLPARLLESPHHRVRKDVRTDTMLHRFLVDSDLTEPDLGPIEVLGDDFLEAMVRELHAIAELRKIENLGQLKESIGGQSLAETTGVGGKLIKKPVDTIAAVPKGAFLLMSRVGKAMGQLTDKSQPKTNIIRIYFGQDIVHQKLAVSLGVNPYSTNETLQHELNRVARTASIGRTGARIVIPWSLITTLVDEELVEKHVVDIASRPSVDLFDENLKQLKTLEVDRNLARKLLLDEAFDPIQETVMIRALASLGDVEGVDTFITNACDAGDRLDAQTFQRSAELLAQYHQTRKPIEKLTTILGYPVGITGDGTLVTPAYCDYATWNREAIAVVTGLTDFATRELGAKRFVIAMTGVASPRARRELNSRGWELIEQALTQ